VTYPGGAADPSRTTVSLNGDVVVANRCLQDCPGNGKASALKIAGDVSGCVDRNKNGKIDTAAGSTPIPWPAGQKDSPDECALWLTDLSDGGTQTLPRAAGFDSGISEIGTHVYIGLFNKQEVVRINASTGAIMKRISVAPAHPYGIVLDKNGAVWVQGAAELVRIDVKDSDKVKNFGNSPCPYGIAADARGNIYTSGSTCVARLDPATGKFDTVQVPGSTFLRGIALDQKNIAWTSDTQKGMFRIDATGAAMAVNGTVAVAGGALGAAIDFDGNPWLISQSNSKAYKVNPANLTTQEVSVGTRPYTYSDMTGFQLRNAGAPAGVFRRTFPGCGEQTRWFDLNYEVMAPPGTEVTVRVRFAASAADLQNAAWTQVAKVPSDKPPVRLSVPAGTRPDFLQVEIGMKAADPKITPILSALSVGYSCNILG
jgi:streptogramin lyase